MLVDNPTCTGVVIRKNGDFKDCEVKTGLKMNSELRYFCDVHFYEPSETPVVDEEPYNPAEYDGYELSERT